VVHGEDPLHKLCITAGCLVCSTRLACARLAQSMCSLIANQARCLCKPSLCKPSARYACAAYHAACCDVKDACHLPPLMDVCHAMHWCSAGRHRQRRFHLGSSASCGSAATAHYYSSACAVAASLSNCIEQSTRVRIASSPLLPTQSFTCGPQLLQRTTTMQRIRHCCQQLY
jgi:hypothetical protein